MGHFTLDETRRDLLNCNRFKPGYTSITWVAIEFIPYNAMFEMKDKARGN